MIRKFLVCGKQLFLSSKKLEDAGGPKQLTVELLLPINLFWEVESLLKKMDYMNAASEDPVLIGELHHKILRKVMKYAVSEKDRMALQEKINGPAANPS